MAAVAVAQVRIALFRQRIAQKRYLDSSVKNLTF